jgi:hypothetical protein
MWSTDDHIDALFDSNQTHRLRAEGCHGERRFA